jgi:hypothetical protein
MILQQFFGAVKPWNQNFCSLYRIDNLGDAILLGNETRISFTADLTLQTVWRTMDRTSEKTISNTKWASRAHRWTSTFNRWDASTVAMSKKFAPVNGRCILDTPHICTRKKGRGLKCSNLRRSPGPYKSSHSTRNHFPKEPSKSDSCSPWTQHLFININKIWAAYGSYKTISYQLVMHRLSQHELSYWSQDDLRLANRLKRSLMSNFRWDMLCEDWKVLNVSFGCTVCDVRTWMSWSIQKPFSGRWSPGCWNGLGNRLISEVMKVPHWLAS